MKRTNLCKVRFPSEQALLKTLKRLRHPKCNKCFVGHNGFDTLKGFWRVCLCVDQDALSQVGEQMMKLDSVDKEGLKS